MKIYDFEQRSEEWFAIRCGIPTASSFSKLITSKGDPSKSRTKYMYQLAGESITGIAEETYSNGAMQRGIELESEARDFYNLVKGVEVKEVGFCMTDDGSCGASPDGLVGEDGNIEIKCPTLAVHVEYLIAGKLPTAYFQQVQGQMFVTGRKWCDFISYYPGMKPLLIRVERDEKFITSLRVELELFSKELKELIEKIK